MFALVLSKNNHNLLSELQNYLHTYNKPISTVPSSFDVGILSLIKWQSL